MSQIIGVGRENALVAGDGGCDTIAREYNDTSDKVRTRFGAPDGDYLHVGLLQSHERTPLKKFFAGLALGIWLTPEAAPPRASPGETQATDYLAHDKYFHWSGVRERTAAGAELVKRAAAIGLRDLLRRYPDKKDAKPDEIDARVDPIDSERAKALDYFVDKDLHPASLRVATILEQFQLPPEADIDLAAEATHRYHMMLWDRPSDAAAEQHTNVTNLQLVQGSISPSFGDKLAAWHGNDHKISAATIAKFKNNSGKVTLKGVSKIYNSESDPSSTSSQVLGPDPWEQENDDVWGPEGEDVWAQEKNDDWAWEDIGPYYSDESEW